LVNGSSYAAAHVSGLLALLKQRQRSASTLVTLAGGRIDACASLMRAAGGCDCSCARARAVAAGR
jgi:hypothetical protein